jgi:hypothetical protein
MQNIKNKSIAIFITSILVLSLAISIGALSTANAYGTATQNAINAGMYWTGMGSDASATRLLLWNRYSDLLPTRVFIIAAPNPVGVGQTSNFVFFNPQVPPGASANGVVRYAYKIDITDPDGVVTHFPTADQVVAAQTGGGAAIANGTFLSDSTGSTYMAFTPDKVGNYTIKVTFVSMRYLWNSTVGGGSNDYYGTVFPEATNTRTLVVQDTPVSLIGLPDISYMPTAYWTRPIEGQNTNWYLYSSNYLNSAHDDSYGAGAQNNFQPDGVAPNSAHILWTRPTEDNGVLGGTNGGRNTAGVGNVFNAGSQYQPRFGFKVIMYGRLYFSPNYVYSGSSEFLDCVDLKTGALLYEINTTSTGGMPSFGYYYSDDNPNEHGIVNPGWLFTNNFATGYEPLKGFRYLNITNAPSGFEVQGPAGEYVRLMLTNLGNSTKPNYYMQQWNSSKVFSGQGQSTTAVNASTPNRYDWNVSSPIQFTSSPTIRAVSLTSNILWGSNGTWNSGSGSPSYAYPDSVSVWAISIDPSTRGNLISMTTLQTQLNDEQNNIFVRADATAGIFVTIQIPTCSFTAYDMKTGAALWTTDPQADLNPYGYYTWPSLISGTQTKIAYGMLYTGGYTGSVSAYYLTNGSLAWRQTYPTGGEKINDYTSMIALIADGKIYVGTHEHSADTPLYKGMHLRCINATSGANIFELSSWVYPDAIAEADGVLIYWNNYDGQIYALGKGPSAMTVEAPMADVTLGSGLVIRGTVLDVSAGTKQAQQAADFPYGVPAVSDESQGHWMEYVYEQKNKPTDTTGVPVTLNVVDANGNYRTIGTVTSDASGSFSYNWVPDIPGKYTLIASFAGSESYWPTSAQTAFAVDLPATTPATTNAPITNLATTADLATYLAIGVIAIIIAIALVGLLLLRKKP